jgi:enoyl-CoA hydratase/carnithine racemase
MSHFHDWIREIQKPVIAAVEGTAAGAGFSLALACDLIVAAEDARFVMAYVKVGLSPDGGGTAFLTQAIPRQTAMEILLDGSVVTAVRLQQLGVVNRLCPPGQALAVALAWAERLAAGPGNAMARIKELANTAENTDLSSQLDRERERFVEGLFSAECEEGIAAFLGKRAPIFRKGATG